VPLRRACLARVDSDASPHPWHPLIAFARTSAFSPPSLAPHWFGAPALAFPKPSRSSRWGVVFRFNSSHLTLLRFARVQSFPRAFLSRSLSNSLLSGLPLISSFKLAPSRPSHGVSHLTATSDPGSDLRRVFHPPTVLRPQAFSTSRRLIPPETSRPCFMPIPPRFPPSESSPPR